MSGAVLVLRPEPAAGRTAHRLAAAGFAPIVYPLFVAEAVAWEPPDPGRFDTILLTSANAARLGGPGLARYHGLPVHAVGPATARAAAAAGFGDVRRGGGDVSTTVPMIAAGGHKRVLHPCGRAVRPYDPLGLAVERVTVYRTVPAGDAAGLAAVLPPGGQLAALVHSPRAGERLAALIPPAGRRRIAIAAISQAAANACGPGWHGVAVAGTPDEDALLACLQMLV